MSGRKPLLVKPSPAVWPVSKGAKLASDSDSSPPNSPSVEPRSGPPPSPRPSLGKSPPTLSPLASSPSLRLPSRPKIKRRNPNFRRVRNRYSRMPRGAKLETDSDLSPEKSPSVNIRPPSPSPLPRPDLRLPARPPSPPSANDRYWVEERSRRLPHYYYHRLPLYLNPTVPSSAVGVVGCCRAGVVWPEEVETEIEDGEEAEIGDGEVPWCR